MRKEILKRLFRERHASLSLSINAIVVLIMAITMLGLGLAFMKNMFGGATSQFLQASDEIKNQLYDKLKTSDKKITLNTNELNIGKGKSATIYVGVKNFGEDNSQFLVKIHCLETNSLLTGVCGSATATALDDDLVKSGDKLGGATSTTTATSEVTIKYIKTTKTLTKDEVAVVPISVSTTSNAGISSYSLVVEVCDTTDGSTCVASGLDATDSVYVNVE